MTRRVAYYLVTSGFGGVELALLTMLRALGGRELEPILYFRCTHPGSDARMREALSGLQVPIRELNEDGLPLPSEAPAVSSELAGSPARAGAGTTAIRSAWYSWRAAQATAQVFRQEHLDIIHFLHGWYPSLELPLLASRLVGIPVRISDVYLEPERTWPKHPLHRFLIRRAADSATRVRAMYPRMQSRLASEFHIRPERITVVPNWVDADVFARAEGAEALKAELGIPPRCRVVTVPARLAREKGHTILFEAIARLNGATPMVRVLLAGDGPLQQELRQEVAARHLEDRVVFLGFRQDLPAVLSASDLVVLPSFTEGLPGVLLEAMAAGKPIIGTDVGGVSDLFQRGPIGRLVTPGDPAQLAKVMEEMLSADDAVLTRMGEVARAIIRQHYIRQQVVPQMIALYEDAESERLG